MIFTYEDLKIIFYRLVIFVILEVVLSIAVLLAAGGILHLIVYILKISA